MRVWPDGLYAGKTLRNPVTGQTLTFLELSPELLVMETTYQAGGPEAPEHYHPDQSEHFVALEGAVRVVVNGQERRLEPGKDLTLPPGTRHRFGALADQSCRARWEVRPALRTAEFLGTTFGLAHDGHVTRAGVPPLLRAVQIAREFDREFRLTKPPRLVQRLLLAPLGAIARIRRVSGHYVPGSAPSDHRPRAD
jgi:quercetin dioxygenase-like cupin family protein